MEKLFQAVYSGILYGSIYGLMAIGLTLIWGSLRMLNMAHGALYLVGGYLAWTALKLLRLPAAAGLRPRRHRWPPSIGLLIQVLLINRLLGRPTFFNAAMIATVGAAIVIESVALLIYGPRVKQMPPLVRASSKFSAS